jgi:alkanesulfonate monooxygenase SsuD/methylene tetrahydromethanopterin reductase-like flavin-dependent oxidoreductase (luciferase family)
MQFSVWPDMSRDPAEVFETARWADSKGLYGIWYADHYMPNTGSEAVATGDAHECWAMLAAIAATTGRLRVGSLVSPTSIHHPAVLAKRAATIDHVSNGRMVLGLGAGWQINEHRAYGIELEPPGRRVDRFEEAIQIIRSLLANDRTTFEGTIYSVKDAPCDPSPIQSPLPLLVGTKSARMMRITARHADEWNTWGAPELAGQRRRSFAEAAASVGRELRSMPTSVQALVVLTEDRSVARAALDDPVMGPMTIAGNAAELIDAWGRYADLGFDEFIVPDFNLGETADERRNALERITAAAGIV